MPKFRVTYNENEGDGIGLRRAVVVEAKDAEDALKKVPKQLKKTLFSLHADELAQ